MAHLKRLEKRSKKEQQQDFLLAFEDCGNVSIACKKSKIPRRTLYNWLSNSDFKIQFEKSAVLAIGILEDEAKRRAVTGIEKAIFYKGKKVATVKEYSDTLLIVLLKAHSPEKYKDRVQAEHSGPNGQPIRTESSQVLLYLPDNGRD